MSKKSQPVLLAEYNLQMDNRIEKKSTSVSFVLFALLIFLFIIPVLLFEESMVFAEDKATDKAEQIEQDKVIAVKGRGGDFSLTGKDGRVSLSDFRGKVAAIYFGYTKCPDVCPTSLSFLSSAVAQLSPEEKKMFQSIFISVDPERDTPDILAEYVRFFDDEMIGLSGAPDDLDEVVAQYGADYVIVPYPNSALIYGVNHTSETYIAGKDGKLFAILPHGTESVKILKIIRKAMQE